MTYRVVGLDLSLTSTGMSDCGTERALQTSPDECLEQRLDGLLRHISSFVLGHLASGLTSAADLVVMEGAAWSKAKQTGHEELSALRVMARHLLWSLDIPYAVVTPTSLKLYTTGNGAATKAKMVAALAERHGLDLKHVKVAHGKYDMADAYALAAMGYAHLGQPLPSEGPPAPLKPLLAVDWPPVPSRV